MNIGLIFLLVFWILSRVLDFLSCSILAIVLEKNSIYVSMPIIKIFVALAANALVSVLVISVFVPFILLGGSPPNTWQLPWIGCAATAATSFKTYTQLRAVIVFLKNRGEHA